MYIDKNCEQSQMVGKIYIIEEAPFEVMCCKTSIPIGDTVEVVMNTSKKIVLIRHDKCLHKVKMSTLNRVGKEINNENKGN